MIASTYLLNCVKIGHLSINFNDASDMQRSSFEKYEFRIDSQLKTVIICLSFTLLLDQ